MEWLEALWKLIVGNWEWIMVVALPFGIALLAKCSWSSTVKGWFAIGVSLVVGVVAAFVKGLAFTPETIGIFLFAVVGVTQAAYRLFKSVGITNRWLDYLLGLGSFKPVPEPTPEC